MLCPMLHPGDIVIMDHRHAQREAGSREIIEQPDTPLLYQPPYSPDVSPIKRCWSKLKPSVEQSQSMHL